MPPPERKLKGVNFHGTLGALERRSGKAVVTAVLARVPGEAGPALRDGAVVSGGWYPAAWYAALLAAILEETKGGESMIGQLARDAVKHDMETIFRVLSIFVSPRFILQNGIKVLKRYVDGGTIEIVSARDGELHYRFTEMHGYTKLMWLDFVGSIEGVMDSARLTGIRSRVLAGGKDGDSSLELVQTYTA